RIDEELNKESQIDEERTADIFGIAQATKESSQVPTEEELILGFYADADKLIENFEKMWQAKGRTLTSEEKQQLEEAIQQKINEEKEQLNKFFKNLSLEALKEEIKPSVLRSDDVAKFFRVLEQKRKNYPSLVNRTSVVLEDFVREFSRQCLKGEIPNYGRTRFLKLRLEMFSGKFALIGKIEDQLRRFLDAIEKDDQEKKLRTIIVIDYDELEREIPIYRGGGVLNNQEPFNLGFFMIPFIGRSEVRLVLSTTKKDIADNEVFNRFFTQVDIEDLNVKEAFEKFYLFECNKTGVAKENGWLDYSHEILEETATLFAKVLTDEPLLEVLVRYFEYVQAKGNRTKEAILTASIRAKDNLARILQGYIEDNALPLGLEDLLKHRELVRILRDIFDLEKQLSDEKVFKQALTIDDAHTFLSERYKLDKSNLTVNEKKNLLELEEHLNSKIIGQEEAVGVLGNAVRLGKVGLKPVKKPVGAFLFTGPTGVGKTELAYRLSIELGMPLFRFDMQEFKNPADVAKLIGAPPGYVGHEDTENLLTTKIIKNPRSIIVFDEVDKILNTGYVNSGAYANTVLDLLLQMLEDGRLTDSHGNTADFSQSIIIFTSNGGVNVVFEDTENGVEGVLENGIYERIKEAVLEHNKEKFRRVKEEVKERVDKYHRYMLRPEFLNRLDKIVVFNSLNKVVLSDIVKVLLVEFSEQMAGQYKLVFGEPGEDEAGFQRIVRYLMNRGFSPENGARGILGLINKDLKDKLNDFLDEQEPVTKEDEVFVSVGEEQNGFSFRVERKQEASLREQLRLSEIEELILNNIIKGLNAFEGQFIDLEVKDVEPWLEPLPFAPKEKGSKIDFSPKADILTLRRNDFVNQDEGLVQAIRTIRQGLAARGLSEEFIKTVRSWVMEAAALAKRENIQQTAWAFAQKIYDFYNLESGEITRVMEQFLEEANQSKFVRLAWELDDKEFKVEITFNSHLTDYLYRRLFEDKYADKQEVLEKANRLLQGLLKAVLSLCAHNAEFGFSADRDASLWLKFPVSNRPVLSGDNLSKEIAKKEKQLAELEERKQALIEGKSIELIAKPVDLMQEAIKIIRFRSWKSQTGYKFRADVFTNDKTEERELAFMDQKRFFYTIDSIELFTIFIKEIREFPELKGLVEQDLQFLEQKIVEFKQRMAQQQIPSKDSRISRKIDELLNLIAIEEKSQSQVTEEQERLVNELAKLAVDEMRPSGWTFWDVKRFFMVEEKG
ncbi:MAG: AAA family ATPase, partial [Candidatus Margulisiibacteriota bacterium]